MSSSYHYDRSTSDPDQALTTAPLSERQTAPPTPFANHLPQKRPYWSDTTSDEQALLTASTGHRLVTQPRLSLSENNPPILGKLEPQLWKRRAIQPRIPPMSLGSHRPCPLVRPGRLLPRIRRWHGAAPSVPALPRFVVSCRTHGPGCPHLTPAHQPTHFPIPSSTHQSNSSTHTGAAYTFIKMLGHGGSASVEMVRHNDTGSVYARKVIRNVYARNLKQAEEQHRREVRIMGRLAAHNRIVRVHSTYIDKRELVILMEPAANGGDLAAFLQDFRDRDLINVWPGSNEEDILYRSFGCLASGLAFMHRQTIRHKDIKPQNVLIHNGIAMYTDFGLSYDFGAAGQSTTTGIVQGLTRRYCAPEVAGNGRRNTKSDVFSLGCVYLEVYAVLQNHRSRELGLSLSEELLDGPFFEKLSTLPDHGLPSPSLKMESPGMRITRKMIELDSSARPTASDVVSFWSSLKEDSDFMDPWLYGSLATWRVRSCCSAN
jgi:serine/threonine protein kinase